MNNNVRHSVGDIVVALDSAPNYNCQPRKKGNIYIVEDVIYCYKCGVQSINTGYFLDLSKLSNYITCTCGTEKQCNGKHWTLSDRFAPLTDTSLQQAVEEENYELAVIIRDALHKTEKV